MTSGRALTKALAVAALVGVNLACGRGAAAADALELTAAWIRFLPGDGPMAGYFVLHNHRPAPITVSGASSPAFGRVMAHRTVHHGSQVGMEPAGPVTVPPGGSVAFRPEGLHLMLTQRRPGLQVGDHVPIELHLSDGTVLRAQFAVRPAWAK